MGSGRSDPARALSDRLSDLYVGLEDFTDDDSAECLVKVLGLLRDLRLAMDDFDEFAIAEFRPHGVSWAEVAASLGDVLYWQGQRLGRTDPLIIDHRRVGERLLLFYRRAKYEFDGAGFRYEGVFEYISHSGSYPTDFVLRRANS